MVTSQEHEFIVNVSQHKMYILYMHHSTENGTKEDAAFPIKIERETFKITTIFFYVMCLENKGNATMG